MKKHFNSSFFNYRKTCTKSFFSNNNNKAVGCYNSSLINKLHNQSNLLSNYFACKYFSNKSKFIENVSYMNVKNTVVFKNSQENNLIEETNNSVLKEESKNNEVVEVPKYCNMYILSELLKYDIVDLIKEFNLILNTQVKEVFEYLNPEDVELFLLEKGMEFKFIELPVEYMARPIIITIMGHVDHGKTTLLDSLRNSNIVSTEFGAITQSIGAFNVEFGDNKITVIDTPGHEAFAKMRLRGAKVTDCIVLVISATEGVKNQTIEVLDIIKANKIPFIIAINKFDLPDADIDDVKQQLLNEHNILVEEDEYSLTYSKTKLDYSKVKDPTKLVKAPYVCISAKYHTNLNILKEKIIEKSNQLKPKEIVNLPAQAYVIESKAVLDVKYKALRSSVIIKKGILRLGDYFLCGTSFGKIRNMKNDKGEEVKEVHPGEAVELTGFKIIPHTGSMLCVVENPHIAEKLATEKIKLNEYYACLKKENVGKGIKIGKIKGRRNRSKLFNSNNRTLWEEKIKEVLDSDKNVTGLSEREIREAYLMEDISVNKFILKVDTEGVLEAIQDELLEIFPSHILDLYIEDIAVGSVNEEDIEIAKDSKGIIFCFNMENEEILSLCSMYKVGCRAHKLIFQLVNDIRAFINESAIRNDPGDCEYVNLIDGIAEVKEIFTAKHKGKSVQVAGLEVIKGNIKDTGYYRVSNKLKVKKYDIKVGSLRQNKELLSVIKEGEPCGLILEDFNDFEVGDKIICYETNKELHSITDTKGLVRCFNTK